MVHKSINKKISPCWGQQRSTALALKQPQNPLALEHFKCFTVSLNSYSFLVFYDDIQLVNNRSEQARKSWLSTLYHCLHHLKAWNIGCCSQRLPFLPGQASQCSTMCMIQISCNCCIIHKLLKPYAGTCSVLTDVAAAHRCWRCNWKEPTDYYIKDFTYR